MTSYEIIVAADAKTLGIGIRGTIPWYLPNDLAHFSRITKTALDPDTVNAVIMGRGTWDSIPENHRPLRARINVVLTSRPIDVPDGVIVSNSLHDAITQLDLVRIGKVFVIGGEGVYEEALVGDNADLFRTIHMTEVYDEGASEFDVYFGHLGSFHLDEWESTDRSEFERYGDTRYRHVTYVRKRHEEYQYLDLVRKVIEEGAHRPDRTGTGTRSIFGAQMRYSLRRGRFPLLTTKRTFFRGVLEELLWFISGSTNSNELVERGIRIWEGNTSRAFLDARGLTDLQVGDIGAGYGFQWRHFGAEYKGMDADYDGAGTDQLEEAIRMIKENPTSRRIVVSAWNPCDLQKMALPPCHMCFQFYVTNGELSCQLYQRSADLGLGVPFNIASYSLLTIMVARVCGLKPGEFIHTIGDAHVYENHVDALRQQLKRHPTDFPTISVRDKDSIDDFKVDDVEISGYKPHPTIRMEMAV